MRIKRPANRTLVRVRRDCPDCLVPAEFVEDGGKPPTIIACTSKVGHAVGHTAGGTGCPLAKYGAGHICDGCYARPKGRRNRRGVGIAGGQYQRGGTARANSIRLHFALVSMMTDAGMGRWAAAVAHAINHNVKPSEPYMRAFDSGDFLNHRHVRAWSMVADRVFPTVIWDPTRAWRGFVDESTGALRTNLWQAAFREFAAKPNVSCRPSALKYDEVPPDLTPLGFSGGHMVVTDWAVADAAGAHRCPSSTQGDRCDGRPVGGTRCDRCYRKDGGLVAFLVHGGA
jgi:hypothetical protein